MASRPMSPANGGAHPASANVSSLILRAWIEPGLPPQLKARLVEIAPDRGERPVMVTTSVDEACRAVRNWLEALQAGGAGENGDGTVTRRGMK
jgi:hypothetical protein